jgi:hypothetical protein
VSASAEPAHDDARERRDDRHGERHRERDEAGRGERQRQHLREIERNREQCRAEDHRGRKDADARRAIRRFGERLR